MFYKISIYRLIEGTIKFDIQEEVFRLFLSHKNTKVYMMAKNCDIFIFIFLSSFKIFFFLFGRN